VEALFCDSQVETQFLYIVIIALYEVLDDLIEPDQIYNQDFGEINSNTFVSVSQNTDFSDTFHNTECCSRSHQAVHIPIQYILVPAVVLN